MKFDEVRQKKGDELSSLEEKLRRELSELRMSHRAGQAIKTADLQKKRRDLARILTAKRLGNL